MEKLRSIKELLNNYYLCARIYRMPHRAIILIQVSLILPFFDLAHCGLFVLSMTECTNVILMGQKPVGLWTSQIRPQQLQMNLVLEVTAEMK